MVDIFWYLLFITLGVGLFLVLFLKIEKSEITKTFIENHQPYLSPNAISITRFILSLISFCCAWHARGVVLFSFYLSLFIFSALADKLDGTVARRCELISPLGEQLDAFLDKLSYTIPLVCFFEYGYLSKNTLIVFVVVETINQFGVRYFLKLCGFSMKSTNAGKIKTTVIFSYVCVLLLIRYYNIGIEATYYDFAMYGAILLSILSAICKAKKPQPSDFNRA